MACERLYFVAAGRSLEIIEEARRKKKAAAAARWDYGVSVGGIGTFGSDDHFTGVVFRPGTKPAQPGWKYAPKMDGEGNDVYVPDARTKAGKELRRHLDSDRFDMPTVRELFSAGWHFAGGYLHYPTIEKVGEKTIITVPKAEKDQFIPDDAVPIKTSEYYRLKEEEAEKAEKKS